MGLVLQPTWVVDLLEFLYSHWGMMGNPLDLKIGRSIKPMIVREWNLERKCDLVGGEGITGSKVDKKDHRLERSLLGHPSWGIMYFRFL